MRCPVCDIQLVEVVRLDIHLDLCAGCRGIWFDSGELEDYRQRVVGGRVLSLLKFVRDTESRACTCPGCGQHTLFVGKLGNLPLDQCSTCRGVFVPATTIDTFKPKSTATAVGNAGADGAVSFGVESLGEILSWLIQGLVDGL